MCGGLSYQYVDPQTGDMKTRKVYFPIPQAKIPVLADGDDGAGEPLIQQWGKRQGEDDEFDVPVTGWARLMSLKEGKWNRYNPVRVKIPALAWMEKDADRQSHWFDMDARQAILGVRIEQRGKSFVYVVTRPAEGDLGEIHERMPLLVPAPFPWSPVKLPLIAASGPAQMRLGFDAE